MDYLELGLKDKVAIVTGASEGLGRACAARFARSEARVAMCARRPDVLDAAANAIRKDTGARIFARPTDVTRAPEVEAFVAEVVRAFGGVDILVNNAGTSSAAGFEAVDDQAWRDDIELKVMGAIRFCRLVIPSMKQRGGGRIVLIHRLHAKRFSISLLTLEVGFIMFILEKLGLNTRNFIPDLIQLMQTLKN